MLELKNVSKTYTNGTLCVEALKNINLHLKKGEFAALIGESGSGKSTLMNMAGCLDTPSDGAVYINGVRTSSLDEQGKAHLRNKSIGFVFQSFYLQNYLSAEENVMLPMIFAGVDKAERKNRAKKLLESVGIGDRGGHRPSQLSGGQRQRVCIARALANNPDIILADEPCGNLDSKTAEEVMALIKSLSDKGITVLMVTHNTEHIKYADSVYVIRDGVLN